MTVRVCCWRDIGRSVKTRLPLPPLRVFAGTYQSLRFFYLHINAQNNRGPFYVPSKLGERLMLPNKYLEDLKSAPVHEVDFVATFIEVRR